MSSESNLTMWFKPQDNTLNKYKALHKYNVVDQANHTRFKIRYCGIFRSIFFYFKDQVHHDCPGPPHSLTPSESHFAAIHLGPPTIVDFGVLGTEFVDEWALSLTNNGYNGPRKVLYCNKEYIWETKEGHTELKLGLSGKVLAKYVRGDCGSICNASLEVAKGTQDESLSLCVFLAMLDAVVFNPSPEAN